MTRTFAFVLTCAAIIAATLADTATISVDQFHLSGTAVVDGDAIVLNTEDQGYSNGTAILKRSILESYGVGSTNVEIDFKLLQEKDNSCDFNTQGFAIAYAANYNCAQSFLTSEPLSDADCKGIYVIMITNKNDDELGYGVYLYSGSELELYWEKKPSNFVGVNRINLSIKPDNAKNDGDTIVAVTIGGKSLGKARFDPSEVTTESQKMWFIGTTESDCGLSHEIYDFEITY